MILMTKRLVLREHEWMKNRWWDTLLDAILEHEWQVRISSRS
jgi:hypothetical protein